MFSGRMFDHDSYACNQLSIFINRPCLIMTLTEVTIPTFPSIFATGECDEALISHIFARESSPIYI